MTEKRTNVKNEAQLHMNSVPEHVAAISRGLAGPKAPE